MEITTEHLCLWKLFSKLKNLSWVLIPKKYFISLFYWDSFHRAFILPIWSDINSAFFTIGCHSTIMHVSECKNFKWSHLHRKFAYKSKTKTYFKWLLDSFFACVFLGKTSFVPGAYFPLFSTLLQVWWVSPIQIPVPKLGW